MTATKPSAKPSKGRSVPRSKRGKRTRDAVLAAAVSVFGREGVRQTSMLAIAEEAGIASGTVYQYFSDKEDVFRCLLDQLDDDLKQATDFALSEKGRLRIDDAVGRYLELHRRSVAIQRAWWDLLEPRTEFTDIWLALHDRIRLGVEQAIESGQSRGLIADDIDPKLIGQFAAMLFERPAYSRNIMGWDEELTDEEVAGLIAQLLGDGLFAAIDPG